MKDLLQVQEALCDYIIKAATGELVGQTAIISEATKALVELSKFIQHQNLHPNYHIASSNIDKESLFSKLSKWKANRLGGAN